VPKVRRRCGDLRASGLGAAAGADACNVHVPDAHVTRLPVDRLIAEVAATQHGAVSHQQLVTLGVGRGGIASRVRRGLLHPMHRGVYLWGHPSPTPLARVQAAVLACGEGAVLSHHFAAARWGIRPPACGPIDVTVIGRRVRPSGIRTHESACLYPAETRALDGIPTTAPARTLLDIASDLSPRELAGALERAPDQTAPNYFLRKNSRKRPRTQNTGRWMNCFPWRNRESHRGDRDGRGLYPQEVTNESRHRGRRQPRPASPRYQRTEDPHCRTGLHPLGGRTPAAHPAASGEAPKATIQRDGRGLRGRCPVARRTHRAGIRQLLVSRDACRLQARSYTRRRPDPRGYVALRTTWHELNAESHALVARIAKALARRRPS
jgi:hypothetical protein